MKKKTVYVSYPEVFEMKKIGVTNCILDVSDIIHIYADKHDIQISQLMTHIGSNGINTHAIRDNFDIMFVSKEEVDNDDK